MRTCKVCGEYKSLSEFPLRSDGLPSTMCRPCHLAYNREASRRYRITDLCKETRRKWNDSHLGYHRENSRKYRERSIVKFGTTKPPVSREVARLYEANSIRKHRELAISLYGGKCECCGEFDPRKLTFDHINGDGKYDRCKGAKFYKNAIALGYPNNRLRLLCFNCNISIGNNGYCPHNGRPAVDTRCKSAKYFERVKKEMIEAYGSRCALCGEDRLEFLTIDHVNGGGKKHRHSLGVSSGKRGFYMWLRKQGWPRDDYQLLCFNCNCSKNYTVDSVSADRKLGGSSLVGEEGGDNDHSN